MTVVDQPGALGGEGSAALRAEVPGPRAMPFFGVRGNLLSFVRDPLEYVGRSFAAHGPLTALVRGRSTRLVSTEPDPPCTVFLYGPELNRQLLSQHGTYHKSALSGPLYPAAEARPRTLVLRRMLTGLFDVNDDRHREQRRLLMPAFHKKRIEGYLADMVAVTNDVLERFEPGETRDISRDMNELTLRVVTRTLFGADLGQRGLEVGQALARWLALFRHAAAFPRDWPGLPYRRWLDLTHAIDAQMLRLIRDKRAGAGSGSDILSALLEATDERGERLSEDELVGHASVLFAAGHDTSSNALSWTLALLSQHPEIHAQLHDEIVGRLRGGAPTSASLGELPFLDAVVKESLRLLPPAPLNHRIAAHASELGGYAIERGTELISSAYHTHRMRELFAEPLRFQPRRWDAGDPGPYAYNPFGGGPRQCIGQSFALLEIKVVLALLLQRFRLALPRNLRVDRTLVITMRPTRGLPMRVQRQDREFGASPRGVRGDLARMVDFGAS